MNGCIGNIGLNYFCFGSVGSVGIIEALGAVQCSILPRLCRVPINTRAASAAHLPEIPNPKSEIRHSPPVHIPHIKIVGQQADTFPTSPK